MWLLSYVRESVTVDWHAQCLPSLILRIPFWGINGRVLISLSVLTFLVVAVATFFSQSKCICAKWQNWWIPSRNVEEGLSQNHSSVCACCNSLTTNHLHCILRVHTFFFYVFGLISYLQVCNFSQFILLIMKCNLKRLQFNPSQCTEYLSALKLCSFSVFQWCRWEQRAKRRLHLGGDALEDATTSEIWEQHLWKRKKQLKSHALFHICVYSLATPIWFAENTACQSCAFSAFTCRLWKWFALVSSVHITCSVEDSPTETRFSSLQVDQVNLMETKAACKFGNQTINLIFFGNHVTYEEPCRLMKRLTYRCLQSRFWFIVQRAFHLLISPAQC